MKKGTGTAITFAVGVFAGIALCGPAAQAATVALTAAPTSQTFYVNGQRVQFEAYEIHGNNFVKLRDIGQAVDFAVDYDGSTNSVHINSALPYQEDATQPAPAASAPYDRTLEETVQAALADLKNTYPTGALYPAPYRSASNGPYHSGTNCAGWATLCSDAAFGGLPWRRVSRPAWDQIRPGDLIEYKNADSYHVVVVVTRTDEYIKVTESGKNSKTRWGGQYFRWWLEEQPQYIQYTRYPG